MLPCLGGIVARDFSDSSDEEQQKKPARPLQEHSAAQLGFPKASRRKPPPPPVTAQAEVPGPTPVPASDPKGNKRAVHFDPASATPSSGSLVRQTPHSKRNGPTGATTTVERPLSDEELSLMGWWAVDPVERLGRSRVCAADDEDSVPAESGSSDWLSKRSSLMALPMRLATLVRCMQSSAPQHQRTFLAVGRTLLRTRNEAGESLRHLFLADGTDSALRWFRLLQIIGESSTGSYRHRGSVTTPIPVLTEEGMGFVEDILRPLLVACPLSATLQADLASPEPVRAEMLAAQLIDVLLSKDDNGVDNAVTIETLLVPQCPTFEDIGALFSSAASSTANATDEKSAVDGRLEFDRSGGATTEAEKALSAGIDLTRPVTDAAIDTFARAYYAGNPATPSSSALKLGHEGVQSHKLVLALTHLAVPELVVHLMRESFALSQSTSRRVVSIADERAQSPLSITSLLRIVLFMCEQHPLATHRFVLSELAPAQSGSAVGGDASKKEGARSSMLAVLDGVTGMLVEDLEQLLMEEDSRDAVSGLAESVALVNRITAHLIPAVVAVEHLSLRDGNNATDVLRMVAALSTNVIRKATDVVVLCVGLLDQVEQVVGGGEARDNHSLTLAWLSCWTTARTAVVHEALVEHERSARGAAETADFAASTAASELLPLALQWTGRGSLVLGGSVLQADSDNEATQRGRLEGEMLLLRSAGEASAGDPSGWMQSMVVAACGTLLTGSGSSDLYRLVAAVYLTTQYRKVRDAMAVGVPCAILTDLSSSSTLELTPLGAALWSYVASALLVGGPSGQVGFGVVVARDIVEEILQFGINVTPTASVVVDDGVVNDDFYFSDGEVDNSNDVQQALPSLRLLVPIITAIVGFVEATLTPVLADVAAAAALTTDVAKNALFASLGGLVPDVATGLLQASLLLDSVVLVMSSKPGLDEALNGMIPASVAEVVHAPVALIALAATTTARTDATQQLAPLLLASLVNRYFKSVEAASDAAPPASSQIGAFVVGLDDVLSHASPEYYDPTALFGFRRPEIQGAGGVDLSRIEESGVVYDDDDANPLQTRMDPSATDHTAMLLAWKIIVTHLGWQRHNTNLHDQEGGAAVTIWSVARMLSDVGGLLSGVLLWRLQASSMGALFPLASATPPHRAVYEYALGTMCRCGVDAGTRAMWPLPQLPRGALTRHHPAEVISDVLLAVVSTPVTTLSPSLPLVGGGGWGVVEKEIGPLTESIGFLSIPPSVIRALLGSLAAAAPLSVTPSVPTSLACNIPPPPPSTLVALVRFVCTDGFIGSYASLQNRSATSPATANDGHHVPLMGAAAIKGIIDGTLPAAIPHFYEQQVINMIEEFGPASQRHAHTLRGSSMHPLHLVAHLIRWAGACAARRRRLSMGSPTTTNLTVAADVISDLQLEQYDLLP